MIFIFYSQPRLIGAVQDSGHYRWLPARGERGQGLAERPSDAQKVERD